MTEFKSSSFVIVKNLLYAVFGGAAAVFIAHIWLNFTYSIIIGSALCLILAYFALFGDNLRAVIDGDELIVYRGKKEKYRFTISQCHFHSRMVTKSGDSDCHLTITSPDGSSQTVDFSMLGASRYYRFLDALGFNDETQTLETTKKQ